MSQEQAKATFITFYSFKGGVGRSMALINTAGILAGRRGFRVLVLDLDLEAPGLSYLNPELPDVPPAEAQPQLPLQPGFVDLLNDAKERGQEADLFTLPPAELESRYTQRIKIPDSLREFPAGSLRIMPTGRFDCKYAQRLDALNLSALYREGTGEPLVRAFKKKLTEAGLYDYVLVDSRTGMSEGAGICTRDLADHLMILSGLNRQNVEGTCEFLREFRAATEGKRTFQIILSPMPNGEDRLLDDRRLAAEKAFQQAWGSEVDLSLEIPYHPQLALTEEPHIFRRRRGYLFEAYRAIEASMLRALGHDAETFRQRIMKSLHGKDYGVALRDLRHMIRLDFGDVGLTMLANELVRASERGRESGSEPSQEPVLIARLLKDEDGRTLLGFVVDKLPLDGREWPARQLFRELKRASAVLGDRLLSRILQFARNDADTLGNYAFFFEEDGYPEAAEVFYKRAVEVDPNHANNLWNYGDFLEKQRKGLDTGWHYFKRSIEADPKDARHLGTYAVFLTNRGDTDGAEACYKRGIEADPKSAFLLGSYAVFLENERGDKDGAEACYKRAIEVDPKHAHNLCNYAIFLKNQREDNDGAEPYYKQAIEAAPTYSYVLHNYALFLEHQRKDNEGAEAYYKRAIEADPKHAGSLYSYAVFLRNQRRDQDGAEAYYKRAIEADPKDADILGGYAVFLEKQCGDKNGAEAYYKRALEADPTDINHLANYGEFLVGLGRLPDGQDKLVAAFERLNGSKTGDMAEVCFSLWLVSLIQGHDSGRWEKGFKLLIQQGFKRNLWDFDSMLQQAAKTLSAPEVEYAKALALAFLDETKVADLERYERWRALEPLDPSAAVPAAAA